MAEGPLRLTKELQRRLVAARNYAGHTQPEMGALLGLSKGKIIQYEKGNPDLKEFEVRTLIAGYSDACGLCEQWFTADWAQLDHGYMPTEDKLMSLEATVRDLMAQLRELAAQADHQLQDGNEKLERFGSIIQNADIDQRLQRIERAVTQHQNGP